MASMTSASPAGKIAYDPVRRGALIRLAWKLLAPFLGLALVMLFFYSKRPDAFLNANNLKLVATQSVYVALPAIGMTFILIGGGIDLSVGSIMALCSVVLAFLLRNYVPLSVSIALSVLLG